LGQEHKIEFKDFERKKSKHLCLNKNLFSFFLFLRRSFDDYSDCYFPQGEGEIYWRKKTSCWSFLINLYTPIKIAYFSLAELLFPIGLQFSPADLLIPIG
jgi:hypothetical protein